MKLKDHLLLGRKVMTNLDSMLKSRDITLLTKVRLDKGMVFPVVMYGCDSWTVKKAEHWRIDAFELWCWRRLLRVPWTARRSNQSILKQISPGCSLEGLMLKLKLQYLATWCDELTHLKRPWCWERLRAGGEGDDRGWDGWMASLTQWTWVWVNSRSWWWTGRPGVLRFMRLQRVGHNWATELNWTEPKHSWGIVISLVISLACRMCSVDVSIIYKMKSERRSVMSNSLLPMNHSMPGLPVHHQLPEFTQTHVRRVGDAIQPSHLLSSPSPPAPNPSQHQGLFQWVNSSQEVAKVLEFQLWHHSFQRTPRTDLL